MITLLQGDGPDMLRSILETHDVRLVLTDPPYGVLKNQNLKKPRVIKTGHEGELKRYELWDDLTPEATANNYRRLLEAFSKAEQAWLHVFVPDWLLSHVRQWGIDLGINYHLPYVWCKTNPPPRINKKGHRAATELQLVFSRGKPGFYDTNSKSHFTCPFHSPKRRRHFAHKPSSLLEHLVRCYTQEGELVVDPFAGGGSTLEVAQSLGRDAIGVERDPQLVQTVSQFLNLGSDQDF